MSRFVPRSEDDEFAWICSEGHWNKRSERMCRQCHEMKPLQPEVLRELLERIHDKHPRPSESD